MYLIQVGIDLGLPVSDKGNLLWFFSILFFATAVHMFFKNAKIEYKLQMVDKMIVEEEK